MRNKIVSKIMKYIKKNKNITIEEEEKMIYGLESIYILVTKLIIIFAIALILGIFKEMLLFLLIFNGVRAFAFGMHASKSWICLIISSISFLGIPYLCKILVLPNIAKIISGLLFVLLIYKYSPADTINRPIINKKLRKKYKILSTIISVFYVILSLFVNNYISNCLLFGLLLEIIFISPITYKIFKLPYNNYLKYVERDEENVFC